MLSCLRSLRWIESVDLDYDHHFYRSTSWKLAGAESQSRSETGLTVQVGKYLRGSVDDLRLSPKVLGTSDITDKLDDLPHSAEISFKIALQSSKKIQRTQLRGFLAVFDAEITSDYAGICENSVYSGSLP